MRASVFKLILVGIYAVVFAVADEQDTHNPLQKIRLRNVINRVGREHIRLSVNISSAAQNGEIVQVKWEGVHNPSFDDWIAVLAPADEEVPQRAPVKYKLASSDFSHILRGEGKLSFSLENHRTDVRIALFRNGFENPHMVAESDVIHISDKNRPSHGRLSLTADPSEMLVQWTTGDSKGGWVKWGEQPGNYSSEVEARDVTYTKEELCGGAAVQEGWLSPGTFHYALITSLKPFVRYYYIFGDKDTGYSDEFSFRAAPVTGPDTEVKILCLADLGQAETDGSNEQSEMQPSLNTTSWMIADTKAEEYTLMVHHGDISYARGYVTQWDRFHDQMEPLVASMPYMTSIGNHERDWPSSGDRFPSMYDSGGECGVPHERRFLMPSLAQDAPWFSFDYGPIHFLHYSTEQDFSKDSKQWKFIKADLEAVDRTRTPWVMVGGHRPIYIDSTNAHPPDGDQPVAEALRAALEQLLYDNKVDVTLQGHHHSYQRTCPVYQGKCMGYGDDGVPNAPIHLVIGNAGAVLCLNVDKVQPEIFEKIHLWWGYTRLHANGTTLHFQMVSDLDGRVIDDLIIRKPPGWGEHWHASRHSQPPLQNQKRSKWWWEQEVIGTPPQVLATKRTAAEMQESARQADTITRAPLRGDLWSTVSLLHGTKPLKLHAMQTAARRHA